jgi:hypothetical protein
MRRKLVGIQSAVLLFLAAACTDQLLESQFADVGGGSTSSPADPTVGPSAILATLADAAAPDVDAVTSPPADDADAEAAAPAIVPSLVLRAGTPGGNGNLDGIGAAARLSAPYSVAVDGAGNVYVADQGNNAVRKITAAGVVTTLAANLHGPSGIAVDGAGTVFVADTLSQTIRKITPEGVVTTLAGTPDASGSADGTGAAARFFYPSAIAVDPAGNAFVADTINQTIRKITPEGVVTTFAGAAEASGNANGTGAAARFDNPEGVAVDSLGNVYVGDTNNETIRKITSEGVVTTLAGTAGAAGTADGMGAAARFSHPGGLIVDEAGNVYVGDTYNQTVRKITSEGVVTTLAGEVGRKGSSDGTGTAARFSDPKGVAVDSTGNVFLADYGTNTIRKITSEGVVTTIAGAAPQASSTDGTGAAARFDFSSWENTSGMAVDSAGTVFLADTYNDTIRKITSAGVVTTLAGTAGERGSDDGTGASARFRSPSGVALDGAGNVYVADRFSHVIRKITPAGVVTTFAGAADHQGTTDGTGAGARFFEPRGMTIDSAGNLFVTHKGGFFARGGLVRRITPEGVVTTLAGYGNAQGSSDGTGAAAGFRDPGGIAVDSAGNLFVTDLEDHLIRRVTSAGAVTTLAGTAGESGIADGTGAAARFDRPKGITVDTAGNLYVADQNNHTVRKITPEGVVTTPMGSAGLIGTKLGPLPASLGAVTSIAMTSTGNLVIGVENSILDVLLH